MTNNKPDELFTIRYFDAFDGWIDINRNLPHAEAQTRYNDLTNNDTEKCAKNKAPMDEYYCIFPTDTTMMVTPESLGR